MRLLDPGARVMQETLSLSFSLHLSLPLRVRWQVCWHSRNNVRKNGTTQGERNSEIAGRVRRAPREAECDIQRRKMSKESGTRNARIERVT